MRRLVALSLSCLALSLLVPRAEAAEGGTIKGVVINGTTDRPQRGVTVTLLGGREAEEGTFVQAVDKTATTDGRGRFEFTGLEGGQALLYTLDAVYDDGMFPGGVITIPANDDVIEVTQRVWNTTADPRAIVIKRNSLFLLKGEEGASIIESFKIVNVSSEAYIGRGTEMGATGNLPIPTLSFPFPQEARRNGVQVIESDLDVPQLLDTGTGIAITSAIPPNETNITFAYAMRVNTGTVDLSRRALYPTLNFNVFAEPPFIVNSNRLVEVGTEKIDDTTYTRYRAKDTLEGGDPIQMLGIAEAGGDSALIAGAILASAILVLLIGLALVGHRSAKRKPVPRSVKPMTESRDTLLMEIAELDLEYRNGKLDEEVWKTKRAKLKSKLTKLKSPEPAS